MSKISRGQALAILGLSDDASWGEIDRRFKRLASETHPDLGGSQEQFAEVTAARDRLRSEVHGGELVAVDRGGMQVSASRELIELEERRDETSRLQNASKDVARGLVRAEVSRLTRSRRRATFLAWLGGGAAGLTLALRATDSTAESYLGYPWVVPVLFVSVAVGAACAIASFAISDQISRIEQAIEDAAETMSTRSTYLDLFYEIVGPGGEKAANQWTKPALVEAVRAWSESAYEGATWHERPNNTLPGILRVARFPLSALRKIARWSDSGRFDPTPALASLAGVIGASSFTRLLLVKGEETRLLLPDEHQIEGRLHVRYRLHIEQAPAVPTT